LPGARLVANPGCYPTSVLLPLLPLASAGAVAGTVVADSKSGVSGAGRNPKQHTHFVEVSENFSPYAIGRAHRHLPEMEQALGQEGALLFSPHLLPVKRGILSTLYVPLADGWDEARAREVLAERYAATPFVRLLPAGELATLAHVVGTNHCVFAVTLAQRHLIVTSAIDNLLKGAAGQAVQNMNGMFSLAETTGLLS
jgi:N-acetyl-gamma-glutamyl-phosphate reductase